MAQFKPASRPGAYNQAIAPVDNVTPLRAEQQTERDNEVKYNKLVADAHRNYNKSWESGVKVEGASRQNKLDLDRLVRGEHQKFEQQAIQNSYDTAIRNSRNEQYETTQNARQLANFVSKAIDTGFTIHKARDEAINKSQTNALQNTMLRHGTSIEQLAEIRGIELDLINDENTTDARVLKYRELGYSNEQLRSIIGAREGVYALAEANAVRQAINLLPVTMFNSGMKLYGLPEGTTPSTLRAAGDTAGLHQAHTQHVQSILRQTGKNFNPATVQDAVQKSLSSVLSQGAQVHSKNETARFESEQINQVRNNVLAGTLPQRWKLSPGLITGDFERLKKLARDPSSGVTKEFVTNLREQVNPDTGIKYGDQYGYEIDQLYDAIHSEEVHQQQVDALELQQTAETYHDSLDKIAAEGGTITPEGAAKIIEDAQKHGLYGKHLNEIKARLNALGPDGAPIEAAANLEWANTVKNNPHLIGWTESKIWEVAPNRKWAQKKISEMHTRQGRDANLKSAEGTIETDLKTRLGEQIKDRYGSSTFYAAYDYAIEKYKSDRAALGKNGHLEALKIFKNDLGDNKHAGRYAVPDVSKDTETVGFNNFQLSAVDINTEPKTYKSLSDDLDKAAVKPSLVSSRLAAIGDIDTAYLTTEELKRFSGNYGNINAPDDPDLQRKMQNIRDAIGGNTTTMDVATAILAARGEEVKTYKAPTPTANRVLLEVQQRHGKDVARQFANGTATVRGQNTTSGVRHPLGHITYESNPGLYQAFGTRIQRMGFTVKEHDDFGGTSDVHKRGAYHQKPDGSSQNEGMDITHQTGDYNTSIEYTRRFKEAMRKLGALNQVIGPGDGDPGHETHTDLGGIRFMPTEEQWRWVENYVFGGNQQQPPLNERQSIGELPIVSNDGEMPIVKPPVDPLNNPEEAKSYRLSKDKIITKRPDGSYAVRHWVNGNWSDPVAVNQDEFQKDAERILIKAFDQYGKGEMTAQEFNQLREDLGLGKKKPKEGGLW